MALQFYWVDPVALVRHYLMDRALLLAEEADVQQCMLPPGNQTPEKPLPRVLPYATHDALSF